MTFPIEASNLEAISKTGAKDSKLASNSQGHTITNPMAMQSMGKMKNLLKKTRNWKDFCKGLLKYCNTPRVPMDV